jgi:hypothetical protein
MIINLLLKIFLRKNREVVKLDPVKEMYWWRFQDSDKTLQLLKHLTTSFTLQYFEAKDEEERKALKGAVLALKILRQGNELAEEIFAKTEDEDERIKMWTLKNNILKKLKN